MFVDVDVDVDVDGFDLASQCLLLLLLLLLLQVLALSSFMSLLQLSKLGLLALLQTPPGTEFRSKQVTVGKYFKASKSPLSRSLFRR